MVESKSLSQLSLSFLFCFVFFKFSCMKATDAFYKHVVKMLNVCYKSARAQADVEQVGFLSVHGTSSCVCTYD